MSVFNKIIKSLAQICSLHVNNHLGNREAGTLTCAELFLLRGARPSRAICSPIITIVSDYYSHIIMSLYVIAAGQQTAQLP